jgi:uncharacterized MAPEG superfamily protein
MLTGDTQQRADFLKTLGEASQRAAQAFLNTRHGDAAFSILRTTVKIWQQTSDELIASAIEGLQIPFGVLDKELHSL